MCICTCTSLERVEYSDKLGLAFHYYSDGTVAGFQNPYQTLADAEERATRHAEQGGCAGEFIPSSPEEVAETRQAADDWQVIYQA